MSEEQTCFTLVQWAKLKKIALYHIPNEAKRSKWGYIKQYRLGTKKGFPDYLLAEPTKDYPIMFFEVKTKGKKPTLEQFEMLELLSKKGYYTDWYDSIDDAILGIERYMGWKK